MISNKSIITALYLSMNSIIIVAILTIAFFMISNNYQTFQIQCDEYRDEIVKSKRSMIKNDIDLIVNNINYIKNRLKKSSKVAIEYEKTEILNWIREIRLRENQYVVVNTFDGVILAHYKEKNIGKNMWEFTDKNGVKPVQEAVKVSKNKEGGFLSYVGSIRPTTGTSGQKITYAKSIPDWQWTVLTGVYLDDIDIFIARKQNELKENLKKSITNIIFILCFAMLMSVLILKYTTNKLKSNFSVLNSFFLNAAEDSIKINPNELFFLEFSILANSVNEMTNKRSQIEKKLKASEMFLDAIVENIPNMIFIKEPEELRFIRFNKAGENLLGYTRKELLGKNDYDFFPKEEADFFTEIDKEVLDKGTLLDIPEEPIQTKIKGKRILHTQKIPIFDKKGKVEYLMGISEDITEQKRLEIQLQQAQKMESIGTLAGGIAHDFNNILSAILGYTEMAKDEAPENSVIHADLDEVLIAGNRAKDLVAQILAFSRQAKSEQKTLQPTPIVKEALKLLRSSIPTTIVIDQNIEDECGMIKADPTQLHQVIMNLCTNAYQAMEEQGGTLSIVLKRAELTEDDLLDEPSLSPGPYIQCTVTDTGPGIDSATLKNIFTPYYTTKEVGKGTGMGLAVVHRIMKNHGGVIKYKSKVGEGTSFHVFFPKVLKNPEEVATTDQPILSGNERILYVDDEQFLADMGKQLIERLGYSVTASTSSLEALEIFKAHPNQYDLIITDQTMPGMTGDVLAKEIFNIRSDMPVILCTGYSSIISREKALAMGISEFVMKPMVKRDIAPLIRKVLDGENS